MKSRVSNLTLLGLFSVATMGTWTQAPAQDPSVEGQWGAVLTDWPHIAVHAILLKTGEVLCIANPGGTQEAALPSHCWLFDPVAEEVPDPVFPGPVDPSDPTKSAHPLLSSGHAALPDGRILFVTGRFVTDRTTIFDPDRNPAIEVPWFPQDPGAHRFYPTCTTLGDGTVLVMAGDGGGSTQSFTPATFDASQPIDQNLQWTELTSATYCGHDPMSCPGFPPGPYKFHLHQYPFMFLLSTGEVVYAGSDDGSEDGALVSTTGTRTLDLAPEACWMDVVDQMGDPINDPIRGGSAVMYRLDKIMKAGGRVMENDPAIADVYTLDATAPNPAWTQRTPMTNLRTDHYLIVLPDGKILAVGGRDHIPENPPAPFINVLEPELYDPTTDTWEPMALMPSPREHHSVALLLPDARVLTAGGRRSDAEIFSPPYLFGGLRPTIESIGPEPNTLFYGGTATVTVLLPQEFQTLAVSLIRLGSATHSIDFDQRFLDLAFTQVANDELSVVVPTNPDEAPPGYYMLFVVLEGVPSKTAAGVSNIVQVAPCPGVDSPTAPTGEAGFDKHRVISIVPQNLGEQTAIRVTHTATGFQWWVGPPVDVSENSSNVNPIPGVANFKAAQLQCSSYSTDWGAFGETIHVYGPEVVPSAAYDVQVIHAGCDETDESLFSAPLTVVTSKWGDIVALLGCPFPTAPEGSVNITDVVAVLDKFENDTCAVIKARADTEPELLDMLINISDALQVINAFSGVPYPFSAPQACP